jgi:hypothetical protein
MRLSRTLCALAAATLVTVACADDEEQPNGLTGPTPDIVQAGGPGLAIYGVGQINRAIPHPCRAPEHRQFDFWLGMWNIENTNGDNIGTSIISSELDGCLVMEDFIGAAGFPGRSLNVYDADTDMWYQTFVDGLIGNFRLSGGLQGDEMVMTGSQTIVQFFPEFAIRQRDSQVTWTPLSGGRVRQLIEAAFDGGPVQTTFDGTYIPAASLDRADPVVFRICELNAPFRELDFWLGSWTVSSAPGPELGLSEVTADLNGCLIEENFATPKGYKNRSFTYFDFDQDSWFRTFADENGEHVELSGGFEDGALVLTGTDVGRDGRDVDLRVTIAPQSDGAVLQTWEVSHDGGASWKTDLTLDYQPR